MDIKYIKSVIKEFESSSVHKMEISFDNSSISLEKETKQIVQAAPAQVMQSASSAPVAQATAQVAVVEEMVETINAPLVGTFYDAPSPKDAPYVKVGDFVKEGQTVCIIEAMKVMNEIKAPKSGIIREVLVKRESVVEFDQPLMVLE